MGIMTLFGLVRILERKRYVWEHQRICLDFLPNQLHGLVWRRVGLAANWELCTF